jgi:hypothetical protein
MKTATVALSAGLALGAMLGAGPAAQAQDDGVVYEPGTPSGKEYAIPLEEARRDAGGAPPAADSSGPSGGAGDSTVAPFGIGIEPRGKSATNRKPSRAGAADSSVAAPVNASPEAVASAESADVSAAARLGLPLLLVLLPGVLVGLLLARRSRATPA